MKSDISSTAAGSDGSTASRRSLIHSPGKPVALVGVEDLLVVDTPDALLICRRGRSQEIRQVVETLEKRRLNDYL